MEYSFAPMEGITGAQFRQAHHAVFPETDRYYLPFAAPNQNHSFSPKELRDLLPENNRGLHAVPQLMVNRGDLAVQAARELQELGYSEVNLNLGCPSQTVVTKGKGAGMLRDREKLDAFLDTVFRDCPIRVSVKTRLGLESEEEFGPILEVFEKYPISELILHPRVQKDQYRHPVRPEAFARAYANCSIPMVYNGDLLYPEDCRNIEAQYPNLAGIMIGRGLLRDPGLITRCKTGRPTTAGQVRRFHDLYYCSWAEQAYGDKQLLCKMKELWTFLIRGFTDDGTYAKRIRKCSRAKEYEQIVEGLFRDLRYAPERKETEP